MEIILFNNLQLTHDEHSCILDILKKLNTTMSSPPPPKNRQLRAKIAAYCNRPRTVREVAIKFTLDAKSASAILEDLWLNTVCSWGPKTGTYIKCPEREKKRLCYKSTVLNKPDKPKKKCRR